MLLRNTETLRYTQSKVLLLRELLSSKSCTLGLGSAVTFATLEFAQRSCARLPDQAFGQLFELLAKLELAQKFDP
jgi:hypothetical protein